MLVVQQRYYASESRQRHVDAKHIFKTLNNTFNRPWGDKYMNLTLCKVMQIFAEAYFPKEEK